MTAVDIRLDAVRFEPAGEDGIACIVVDRADDAVNSINAQFVDELAEAIRQARTAQPRGLIVTSAKRDQWVAGADLKLVTWASDASQLEAGARRLQSVLDELAWLPFTTVAAINGAALGGGLELALACDYRVASDSPSVSLGQPEVNLGLIPGGGGTQRLPRLIGLERALDFILNGRRLNARRALRAGVLDQVVHPTVLERAARTWAAKPKRRLDRRLAFGLNTRAAIDLVEQTPPGRQLIYRQARQAVLERTHAHYPAPLKALEAVEIGFEKGMAAGLEAEARAFGELASSQTARNLIWLFLESQRRKRRPERVTNIAVVGAGFMGAAIAEVSAAAGLTVRVKDVTPEAVAKGLASIRKMIDTGVARRRFDAREGQAVRQRVSASTDYSGFTKAELVIEAVFEKLDIKRQVIGELEDVVSPHAVIATNTSAIPIHEIARQAKHPERIVGMHFFSPAERMPLLEVVKPDGAADWALQRAAGVGTRLGKTVIVVGDSPGFYTSRVLGIMLNEAALMLSEGARMEDVDRTLTDFGFPVGPFVLYDEVGLEVAQHAGETVSRAFGDRIPPATIVTELVALGDTGRKAGRGFYIWPKPPSAPGVLKRVIPGPKRTPNPAAYGANDRREFDNQEIQDRLVLLFVNEAIRCLDEGVIRSPADGDLGAILGLGFPPFTGGPFHYADSIGARPLAERLRTLAQQHGPRFDPSKPLIQGHRFYTEIQ